MKYKYHNKDLNDAYNDGYLTAQKEFLDKIEKIENKYRIKSSDGGFPIEGHIGFKELKKSLEVKE